MEHADSSFLCGCGSVTGHLFFAKEQDGNADVGVARSDFFVMNQGKWGIFPETVPWPAISMATLEPLGNQRRLLVGIGPHGQTWECLVKPSEAKISEIAAKRGKFLARRLSTIGSSIFAAGMGRSVHSRTYDTAWKSVGPTDQIPQGTAVGFNDIVGTSEQNIYAVGWGGEIYHSNSIGWRRIESPVSSHLRSAHMTEEGMVYAVGYKGTLVRGSGDTWESVETQRSENLQDVCVYGGTVYVVSDFKILTLTKDGLVPDDRFENVADRPASCLHLISSPQGLFSMGPKDLVHLSDGGVWRRVV
jgi:hypothetical protein